MSTNIFREIKMGKEVFLPISYDENSFVMDWTMGAGGLVPSHVHQYSEEQFVITKGEATFAMGNQKITKKAGETFTVAKGVTHSVRNTGKGDLGIRVTYSPCADVHKMFEIMIELDPENPGSGKNMIKYFYLVPRLGLKGFSSIKPDFAMSMMNGIATMVGKLAGWDRIVNNYHGR